mgnify:CR=1 FL=1
MKLPNIKILDEKNKILHQKSKDVTFPVSKEDRRLADCLVGSEMCIRDSPKIISQSEELIYVGEGEGCLSVNREVEGIVPRHARITIEYYDYEGNKKTMRAREDLAVAFQHEIDHLDGILFVDKIDPKNPYKDRNKMREI